MAAPSIGRRNRWLPRSVNGIDWGHPLAAGLRFAVASGGKFGPVIFNTAPPPPVATPWGKGFDVSGANSLQLQTAGISGAPPVTFASAFVRSAGQVHGISVENNNGGIAGGWATNGRCWQFRLETSGADTKIQAIVFNSANNAVTNTCDSGALTITGFPVVAVASVAADRQVEMVYRALNGQAGRATATSTNSGAWSTQPNKFDIGRNGTTTGAVFASWVWLRQLTLAEMQQFTADPFAMFRY